MFKKSQVVTKLHLFELLSNYNMHTFDKMYRCSSHILKLFVQFKVLLFNVYS